MPKLYGDHVCLRASERTDLPTFVRWFGDPEVSENLSMIGVMGLANEEIWFEDMLKRPAIEQVLVIEAAIESETADVNQAWLPIGTISLFRIDTIARSAELGIAIGEKAYWNQGFGSEAIRILLNEGFYKYNLHRIELQVYARNHRAIKAYEKVGFVHEGTKREATYRDGEYMDMLMMSVLRPEWDQIKRMKG
ncbi:MAG: GNAT family protein [Anaerolineaceae bacterium]